MLIFFSLSDLAEFKNLPADEQLKFRERAIKQIQAECKASGKIGVVAGHFMFWNDESQSEGQIICTPADLATYTYIIYLDADPTIIHDQRAQDTERPDRPALSSNHLAKWQTEEKQRLRTICYDNKTLFSVIQSGEAGALENAVKLLRDFAERDEENNKVCALSALKDLFTGAVDKGPETVLVIDADKTLAPVDTGAMFWQQLPEDPMKTLFSSPMGYSYQAFRQARLMYEEYGNDHTFDKRCHAVAEEVVLYPEFRTLLNWAAEQSHVRAVVVTAGLHHVWEKVLTREGLSASVKVIGGGRFADQFVVTPEVKGELVVSLQNDHQKYMWVFGDSPVDEHMLIKADRAVIVVGEEPGRSSAMDQVLPKMVDTHGFRARQVLLPTGVHASSRFDDTKLPVVDFNQLFDKEIRQSARGDLIFTDATNEAASKLLARNMRDSSIAGPALREAHRQAGRYLALEYVADIIGLEHFDIKHVLGNSTTTYRLLHEDRTSIIACLRGGEPMALGVSEVFPLARFYHSKNAEDLEDHHVKGQSTVLLVDSVINEGDTIVKYIKKIRQLHCSIRVIVIAGVVQDQSVKSDGKIQAGLDSFGNLNIVTLRTSTTKFKGSGTNDTGNRLFNTTYKK